MHERKKLDRQLEQRENLEEALRRLVLRGAGRVCRLGLSWSIKKCFPKKRLWTGTL